MRPQVSTLFTLTPVLNAVNIITTTRGISISQTILHVNNFVHAIYHHIFQAILK